jgi:chromosome segregation ATPase
LSDRCRGLEDKHEHVQDSLENLRSLLVIISSRPKVKGDAQLTAELVQASASVAALCETSEDDPGRRALEEFLADYSRLQDEREEIEKQMAALTDDSDHLRKKNKKLEAVVEELRDALEDAGDDDSRKVQAALATVHGVESKQLKEELEHWKVQYQAVSDELKISKDEIEKLRSNVNQSVPLDQASSNEQALQMKIEDLERILRNQDKLLEDVKKQESARMSERQKLEEDMEQLQLKNVTLLEKVAEIDMKPPLRRRESQDKALKEMQEELTKSKQELKEKGERYAKEKADYETSITELKKNVDKLEKANAKYKAKGGKSTDDADEGWKKVVAKLESTNKTLLADISKLKNENERGRTDLENVEIANKKLLAEEVQKLRRLEAEKGRDRSPERDDKKTLKKQIDNLVAEKERLKQENEQLKSDLDQVASMFEAKQGQSVSQSLSPNASWSGDSMQLSEYALMIRLKLQELKHRSCAEASRLREDNQRLKDELEHFHKLSQHIVATKDNDFQKDAGLDRNSDTEVTLFPQTLVEVQATPSSQSDSRLGSRPNDVDEQLRRENAELKTEISALRRRLADLEAKYKETAELAERKTADKLQGQSQESRDARRVELLESKNRELEAEVTTLAKSVKRLQRQNDRLSANLVDDRLAQVTSTSTHGQPVSIDEKHKQLTEENMMLRKKLRVLEERLADCAESSSGGGGIKMNTDKNNNSETSRLRKQLEVCYFFYTTPALAHDRRLENVC